MTRTTLSKTRGLFFAWYHGLAIGPIAQVNQIQLVQPVLSTCWAAVLLGESLTCSTVIEGVAVILCARITVRIQLNHSPAAGAPNQTGQAIYMLTCFAVDNQADAREEIGL
ncbi:hypothetical protein IWX65_003507 [Arthrobacter sp. CAN_A214]